MFAPLQSSARSSRRLRWTSIASHGLLLAWILHSPTPLLLNPVSVSFGHNGNSLTRLYWTNKLHDDSTHDSSDDASQRYRRQRMSQQKLVLKVPVQLARLAPPALSPTPAQDNSQAQTLSAQGHGTQAGLSYGTLNRGQVYGDEIIPALPIATSDPVVYPWQRPDSDGIEVIEITIDQTGTITNKVVLQSLSPEIDSKCLAALDNWRFHPATRNGAPIASRQDAVFPFKARG